MYELTINANDASQRLDKFLTKFMPALPKSMLYKGMRKNCVKVNGKHIKNGDYILKEGDNLKLYFKDEFFAKKEVASFGEPLKEEYVVYEDDNIIVIDKPSGIVVHTDDNKSENTLINMVKSYLCQKGEYAPENEHSFSPALCNRLDKNTSGLIIAAKTALALRIINEKIKTREIKKFYLCAVEGTPPQEGILEGYLTRYDKIVRVSDTESEGSKPIKTGFKLLKTLGNASIMEIELFTGRTHQIRAHMAHIGHPLVGDIKYGAKTKRETYQALQSHKLIFAFETSADELDYLNGKEFISKIKFTF